MRLLKIISLISFFFAAAVFTNSQSFADTNSDINNAMNEAMAFSSMFPPGTKTVTKGEHKKAEMHLKNSLNYGRRPNYADIQKNFDTVFANEWQLFMQAIAYRLDGWRNPNQEISIKGIKGIERFRNFYNKNSEMINNRLAGKDESSWFTWNPKKGDFLPRIGCEKGAVISWLAGC
jgi:hypothetical protein